MQRQKKTLNNLAAWVILGFLMAGTARAQQAPSTPDVPAKSPSTQSPTNNIRPAMKWKEFSYTCDAGAKLTVYLHSTTAKVRTEDHLFLMRQTPSADGTRYSDGKVLWWSKGDAGFLQEDTPDGDGKMIVKGCLLNKPADAAKP
jgi:membrane-bound inhibitor of C-type lysozyme